MFSCNGGKCKSDSNRKVNWTKCICEIYTQTKDTVTVSGTVKTETRKEILYKGLFGVFTRDYTIENGAFSGKAEIKVDVSPSLPLTRKFDISQHFSKLYIKIYNTHTPKQYDIVQVKRFNPNGYKNSLILIGNLIYNK